MIAKKWRFWAEKAPDPQRIGRHLHDPAADRRHRRQLTPSQLTALALEVKPHYERMARERQAAAQETSPKRGGKAVVTLPQPIMAGKSRDQAAAAVGVSGSLVQRADPGTFTDPGADRKVRGGKQLTGAGRMNDPAADRRSGPDRRTGPGRGCILFVFFLSNERKGK